MARVKQKIQGFKKGQASSNPDRAKTKSNMRDRATINRLNMYKSGGRAIRNREGKIVKVSFKTIILFRFSLYHYYTSISLVYARDIFFKV